MKKMRQKIFLNGAMVNAEEALLSVQDHGFLYGNGLFETMRAYHGQIFRCQTHIKRLLEGVKILGWNHPPSEAELMHAVDLCLKANGLLEASVRLTVSRGSGGTRPDHDCSRPGIVVFAGPYQAPEAAEYQTGWSVVTASIRRNPTSPVCRIKSANYLDSLLARAEAHAKGAKEALLLNTNGMVAEGTIANYFFILQDKLVTPDIQSGLLPGITRATVLSLADQLGMPVEIRFVYPDEIIQAQEVFITNSLLEIMPVNRIDGRRVGSGFCGPVTDFLIEQYKVLVRKECSIS